MHAKRTKRAPFPGGVHAAATDASRRLAHAALAVAFGGAFGGTLGGCFDGLGNMPTGGNGAGGSAVTTTGTGGQEPKGGSGGVGGASAGGGGTGSTECMPGQTKSCYSGPPETAGVSVCQPGVQVCNALGVFAGPCLGEVLPQPETCNTPIDDDCDGQTNEDGAGCVCTPGELEACYTGPPGTLGVGICVDGVRACDDQGTSWGPCLGDVTPEPEGCLDDLDNDCNGEVNEDGAGCICTPNQQVSCYTGPAGTLNVGVCRSGKKTCNAQGSGFGPCVGEVTPLPETCNTPGDDDCNGQINEGGLGCVCTPGSTTVCYTGPAGTLGVGVCKSGQKTCLPSGLGYGACEGEVLPQVETCNTPVDDDCDGQTNESGAGCVCTPNAVVPCYTGPAGTMGVGICKGGLATCNALGTALGPCSGDVTPQLENCFNGVDDNCDGQTNEGCSCQVGDVVSCYSGPAGTLGVGPCAAGTRTCDGATNTYGPCVGDVVPQTESCLDNIDNNCNGQTNEGGIGCVCTPDATTTCYSGPAGTLGVGPCKAGTHTCNGQGTAYGPCIGEVLPQAETCLDNIDNDCNGQTNEGGVGCVCAPSSTRPCYSGPAGTAGTGACKSGMETCNAQGTAYGACVGEVLPQAETCNTPVDDDCNGQTNEGGAGCVCTPNSSRPCYSGPQGTQDVGICKGGTQVCNGLGTAWGACAGEITPQPENCATVADEDCDGAAPLCGPLLWAKGFGGLIDQEGMCVTTDPSNNIYIGGYTATDIDFGCGLQKSALGDTPFVAKFDPAGNCLWSKVMTIVGTPGTTAQVKSVATDAAGNVFAGIYFFGNLDAGGGTLTNSGASDVAVVKYNAAGVHQWSYRWGNFQQQTVSSVATDPQGNVYVSGYFFGVLDFGGNPMTSAGNNDVFIAKLGPTGNHIWSKRFGNSSPQLAVGLTVDKSGNAIISGAYAGTLDFGGGVLTSSSALGDPFIAKFDPNGNHIFSKTFASPGDDGCNAVGTDSAGNVYATGVFGSGTINFGGPTFTNQGGNDVWLAKFDPLGNHIWSNTFGNAGNQGALSLAVDSTGNVSIGGPFDNTVDFGGGLLTSAGQQDMFVAKYSSSGAFLWAKGFGTAASEFPRGLAVDTLGNVISTGLSNSSVDFGNGPVAGFGGEDIFLVKLGP